MIDFAKSNLLTPHTIPETGLTIYLLTEKVAPLQQGFYFVNSSMSDDGRYLWFYCAFPPTAGKTLGLVDFETGTIQHFPQTGFGGASPYVDPQSGTVYWGARNELYCMTPDGPAEPQLLNSVPDEVTGGRPLHRLATHLTPSADGKEFFVDMAFGLQWVMGSLPVDGGDFQFWHRFDRHHNHAQFSPTDPNMALFAEEFHSDPITGLRLPITNRMWLIERGKAPESVYATPTRVTHEWWDLGGEHIWCVWGNDAWRTSVETREVEKFPFPAHCWHAHNTRHTDYLICDSNEGFYRGCPSSVYFYNTHTQKHLHIIDNPAMHNLIGRAYHIDPHPRFCASDEVAVFTTTIRGEVDVALVKTADMVALTS